MKSNNKIKAKQQSHTLFFLLWGICVLSFIISAITNQFQIGVRIFVSGFWVLFAIDNLKIYSTGRIDLRLLSTSRRVQPLLFWIVAIIYTTISMGISSILLIKAFTAEIKISSHGQMNMICNAANATDMTVHGASDFGQISMELRTGGIGDGSFTFFLLRKQQAESPEPVSEPWDDLITRSKRSNEASL